MKIGDWLGVLVGVVLVAACGEPAEDAGAEAPSPAKKAAPESAEPAEQPSMPSEERTQAAKGAPDRPSSKPDEPEAGADHPAGDPGAGEVSDAPPPIAVPHKYRVAVPIPGRPGWVFNPFTNNPVDVQGLPPGTLVRDPEDSDPNHKFRIP